MFAVLCVQFTGIAAQDFTTDGGPFKATRKWEQNPKFMHKAYVWSKFKIPPRVFAVDDYRPPTNQDDPNILEFDYVKVDVSPTAQGSRQHVPHGQACND
jgi:hypothetical protein